MTSSSAPSSPQDQPFHRIILPLGAGVDTERMLLPTTVLASWFNVAVQIVCDREEDLAGNQILAGSLGVQVEPVVYIDQSDETEGSNPIVAFAHSHEPSLLVVDSSPHGLGLAAASTQPVLIVAKYLGHRMPIGPLATEITGHQGDMDALALTSVVARSLGESIRLVVGTDDAAGSESDAIADRLSGAEARLREMGCDVGIDALRAHGLHPLVLVGRTRGAVAVVLPQHRIDEPGLIDRAVNQGVNVFIAPALRTEAGRPPPFEADLTKRIEPAPDGATLAVLDRTECLARLERHTVARIGYIDAGWPVVVPVNYRVHNGDIFIRSLAGGKLRAAERHDTVCLEIDGYDEQLRTGWSVTAHGTLEIISDAATLRQAWANDPQPWVAAEGWQWLRMVPFAVAGREVFPQAVDQVGS